MQDENVVGVALVLIIHSLDARYLRIEDFCIGASHQRVGLGSEFFKLIIKASKHLGCDSILLGTQKDFPSNRFYLKASFREIE